MIQTYNSVRNVRPIAENVIDSKRLLPYMIECENIYLKPIISPTLYKTISDYSIYINQIIPPVGENETPIELIHVSKWDLLFNGGLYDNDESEVIGLYESLGYLSYSRFVKSQGVNVTAFGIVNKRSESSDPIEEKTLFRVANDAEKIGKEYLRSSIEYLKFIGEIRMNKIIRQSTKFISIGD